MRPLQIDFLARSPDRVLSSRLVLTIAVVAIALTAWQFARGWSARNLAIELASQQLAEPAVGAERLRTLADQARVEEARRIAAAAGFDSGRVLADVEGVRQQGVRLTSLTIDPFAASVVAEFEILALEALAPTLGDLNGSDPRRSWEVVAIDAPREGRPGVLRVKSVPW